MSYLPFSTISTCRQLLPMKIVESEQLLLLTLCQVCWQLVATGNIRCWQKVWSYYTHISHSGQGSRPIQAAKQTGFISRQNYSSNHT